MTNFIRSEMREVFSTSDGKEFLDEGEATEHEFQIKLGKLCSDAGYDEHREAAMAVINQNRRELFKLLNECDLELKP